MNLPRVTPTPAQDDAAKILDAIRRLVRGLRVYSRECEAKLGLSAAQLYALGHLQGRGGMSLRDLAAATLTDLSSVSVVVTRLEEKGLLLRQRALKDKRNIELRLSPQGTALLSRAPDALQDRMVACLLAMPDSRRRALALTLQDLVQGSGLAGQRPDMLFEDR